MSPVRALRFSAALMFIGLCAPGAALAQERVRDLVLNGGVSIEAYRGNLAAATVSVADTTDRAAATIGELVEQGTCDEILLSTPPEHHPHWHRHGLPDQIQKLDIPVTVIPPDPTGWSYAHGFPDDWVRTEVGPLT